MFVACSTLCFGRHPLEDALRLISELHFSKFDVAIHEHSRHLTPSQVVADTQGCAARLRYGSGLAPSAFSLEIDTSDPAEYQKQFHAVCKLARISAVATVTIRPASIESPLQAEVTRLGELLKIADGEGVLLCVSTIIGTHTQTPQDALNLCEQVPGLGLTLDPSHYTTGPHNNRNYDEVFPLVRHVHLRDTGRGPNQFQVRIGQGEVEYGRVISHLWKLRYERTVSIDIRDIPDAPFPMIPEVRKLKYLLESLI